MIGVLLTAFLVTALGIYLNLSCPSLSDRIISWKEIQSGVFQYGLHAHKIFYKDSMWNADDKRSSKLGNLILLHGFPTSSFDWMKLWPGLVKEFDRVIAIDFLGFGLSDNKPRNYNYTIFEQADIVTGLLAKLGIKEFHVLSHDFGDTVGLELLHRYNKGELSGLRSLCLLNGGFIPETIEMRLSQKVLLMPVIGKIITRFSNRYVFSKGLSGVFGSYKKPSPTDLYDFWCLHCYNDGYINMADIQDYQRQRIYNEMRWRNALTDSRVPLHFVYGPADPVNPMAVVHRYREYAPKGTYHVLNDKVGHYPHYEDDKELLKVYLKFVRSN